MIEKSNFNQPQRQSLIGVLVMFTDTVQKIARALWPILVVWIFKFNELNKLHVVLGFVGIVLLVGIIAYLQYWNFTFYIDEENDEFIINKGILNKSKIAIQLHKIQQVNINQSFVQKLIGVHALDVDTAGSNKKEVSIRAISHDLALALKTKLLSEAKSTSITDETSESVPSENEAPFIAIGFLSLVKIGITSNYVRSFGLLLAFFFTIYENVQNLMRNSDALDSVDEKIDTYINENMAMYSAVLFISVIFLVIIIINLVRTLIKYFDFKIAKQNRSLLLSYGLLNTKSTIIKPEKVQIVALSQNWLQKKMDVLNFKIKQASGNESDKETKKSAIEIPGCNETEKEQILKLLFAQIPEKGAMLKPNFRKLLFPTLFLIVLPVFFLLLYGFSVNNMIFDYIFFLPAYLIFVGVLLFFSFRNYRLFVSEKYIIKQSGAWDIDNEIIEPHKIQAIKVSQFFWHKRANIGSVSISTAGGTISFHFGNFSKVKELVNLWLYQVETTEKNWM
ncbi:PH domain-containing protein [Flavobacterium saliperosum]|uniref:Putative membrane protein n=1 Tax=Flavobacterium saliperosum TaxID=329186 RepID=A0A1G4VFN7_9FLAO|nr:PH domain-containing protein [Flavobacterium saliperosum]SCX05271.1 putative membrane protein [Flavobacterium saliperosum]